MTTLQEAINGFRTAAAMRGLVLPSNIVTDGNIHRCDVEGAGGKDDGAYLFHSNSPFSGGFQNHRDTQGWKNWTVKNHQHLTAAERQHLAQRYTETRRKVHEDRRRTRLAAAQQAADEWEKAKPAPADHPYLKRKGVQPHGLRLLGWALLMPLRDTTGMIHTHQRILPKKLDNGNDKLLLKNGAKAGHFYLIGEPGPVICIAEGFATAASVHEATGYPVAVACDADNLTAVAKALRQAYPDAHFIVCADDDYKSVPNKGITKASEAAAAVQGTVAIPDFTHVERGEKDKDFNDMARLLGLAAVKEAVAAATGPTPVQDEGKPDPKAWWNDCPMVSVPEEDRPCFRVFDYSTRLEEGDPKKPPLRPGVYSFYVKHRKNEEPELKHTFICAPLHVEAITRDTFDRSYGRLLHFKNTGGNWIKWAMPMESLATGGDTLRAELLHMGLDINHDAKDHLNRYLSTTKPEKMIRCATAVGWSEGVFVLPDASIGEGAEDVIFQSGDRPHEEFFPRGTLAGWQEGVARLAVGNPLLILVLSASFAGALLKKCHITEGGGLHFYAHSSTGKTTLFTAAASTWGGENYRRSWRATANGMEAAATLFNDGVLILDEISECQPRDIGTIIYALGNGYGKQRANRSGAARGVARWQTFILSNGEKTVATAMLEDGLRTKGGQEMRLLNIPVNRIDPITGKPTAWDTLHGFTSGAAFSDGLKAAASQHHGHAGRAFLEKLTRTTDDLAESLRDLKAVPAFAIEGGEGQEHRAAGRFALIALAGELAIEWGIVPWAPDTALKAAAKIFATWRQARPKGSNEKNTILQQIDDFIDKHGDSRFSEIADKNAKVINRAGWWKEDNERRLFYFTADGLREALKGFDFNNSLDVLEAAGRLDEANKGTNGRRAKGIKIEGRTVKLYVVKPEQEAGVA
jgi:putative DNA primase/helicase